MSVSPWCPVLLAGCGLLLIALLWMGLCCSTEAQDGEEAEEEEEERGRSEGEAGVLAGFSFSIMVPKSLRKSAPFTLNCVSVDLILFICA